MESLQVFYIYIYTKYTLKRTGVFRLINYLVEKGSRHREN